MKKILANNYIILISRVVLGSVFIIASVDKIATPGLFAVAVERYGLLPLFAVNIAAIAMPWSELVSGLLVILGVKVRAASALLTLLLGVFIVALLSALARGLEIDCGCFGWTGSNPLGWHRVIEDVGLMVLSLHLLWFPPSRLALVPESGEPS